MRLSIVLSLVAVVSAAERDLRRLSPEDIGVVHNEVLMEIADMYKSGYQPKTSVDLMMDLSELLEGYCATDDAECRDLAYEGTLTEFSRKGKRQLSKIEYPDDFNVDLIESINKIDSTIKQINEDNVDDIVATIEEITAEIRDMGDVHAFQQTIALSAASIAKESTKLWHEVFHTDQNHPLRRLQDVEILGVPLEDVNELSDTEILGPFEGTYDVIASDITGGLGNAMNIYEALLNQGTASAIFAAPTVLVIAILMFAVPASTASAAESAAKLVSGINPFD